MAAHILLALAATATAQPQILRDRDFVAMEAKAAGEGWQPLTGFSPPDRMVQRLVWQQAPLADVPPARLRLRQAIAAERLGMREQARERWGAIASDASVDASSRSVATLALLRLNIVDDTKAARAMPADAS